MALIKCKGCGHILSDKAYKCPHCGTTVVHNTQDTPVNVDEQTPLSQNGINKKLNVRNIMGFIIIVVLLIIVGVFFLNHSENEKQVEDHEAHTNTFSEFSEAMTFKGNSVLSIDFTPPNEVVVHIQSQESVDFNGKCKFSDSLIIMELDGYDTTYVLTAKIEGDKIRLFPNDDFYGKWGLTNQNYLNRKPLNNECAE